jgi:DNA polymerase I-like protein with 3'-5' exonuclease and polymerase domains
MKLKYECPDKSCEFKGQGSCPYPIAKNHNCIYYVESPCVKCNIEKHLSPSFGDPNSKVMVIGGCDFDSDASILKSQFDQASNETCLPASYYFTYAVKCKVDKKPTINLIKRCNSFIKREIDIIKPKYIMLIGETAFKAVLWDFDLITRRKPEIDTCAGTHIIKDGVVYIPVHNFKDIENSTKRYAFQEHIKEFLKLINGKFKITPTYYKEVDSEKDFINLTNIAEESGRFAIDIETNSFTPFLPNSEITSISLSVNETESFVVPISFPHEQYIKKWNYTPKINTLLAVSYIKKLLKNPNITKIFHNALFDIVWLETILNIKIVNYDDTMIMKFLLNQNEQERKGLKPLLKQYTDVGFYEYALKQYVGEGDSYMNIPPDVMIGYNGGDTDGTLRLWNIFRPMLKDKELYNIHYDFMIPELRGIMNLIKTGISLDIPHCIKMKEKNEGKLVELHSKLKSLKEVSNFERETGLEFNPGSDKHKFAVVYGREVTTEKEVPRKIVNGKKQGKKEFQKIIFSGGFNLEAITVSAKNKDGKREQRKSFGKTAIQKYLKSIYRDVEYLDPINTFNLDPLPEDTNIMKFIKLVSEIGSIQTQLSNHIDPFINLWGNTVDGCVHTSYDITGTATGRLSSRNPNLQNLKRDGFVKEAFGSRWGDEGILLEADYKQLELFIMAIVSQDPTFIHAFTHGIDLHLKTAANIVFRCAEADVSKQMRTMAKTVNFGMIYGKTAYSLKDDLNVTEEEAQAILEGYFREYPGVYNYCERIKSEARAKGYVTTVMGRRRYLDYSDPNGADRQAVNTTIQSPASDVCVTAINLLDRYYTKIATDKALKANIGKRERIDYQLEEEIKKNTVALACATVHDSIVIDCKRQFLNPIVKATKLIMENTGLPWLTIPLKVDIKYGKNLRTMEEWDNESEIVLDKVT